MNELRFLKFALTIFIIVQSCKHSSKITNDNADYTQYVNPCSNEYVLGAIQLEKAIIRLSENKTFTMEAINYSLENIYVQSIELNGQSLNKKVYLTSGYCKWWNFEIHNGKSAEN